MIPLRTECDCSGIFLYSHAQNSFLRQAWTDLSGLCIARPHGFVDLGTCAWQIGARTQVRQSAMRRLGNTKTARHSIGGQLVDRDVFAAPKRNRAAPARAQRAMLATLVLEKTLELPKAPRAEALRYRRIGGTRAGASGRPESQLQADSP